MDKLCKDCKVKHEEYAFCGECESCLRKHSYQVRDLDDPHYECKNCHAINFWNGNPCQST